MYVLKQHTIGYYLRLFVRTSIHEFTDVVNYRRVILSSSKREQVYIDPFKRPQHIRQTGIPIFNMLHEGHVVG